MGTIHPGRSEHPELSERELSYISLHTNFTRKQIEAFHIRFHSHYPRGHVTFEQFTDLYSSELQHLSHAQPLLERLFQHIDTDKNGRLNFKEMLAFKAISLATTTIDEKLRWIFLLYDTNQDRLIDYGEFLDLCHVVHHIHGHALTTDRLTELRLVFDEFDTDNDKQLSCNEFLQLCKQCTDVLELIAPMFKGTNWNAHVSSDTLRSSLTHCGGFRKWTLPHSRPLTTFNRSTSST